MRRFPNGVDAGSFFEKRCPKHRPEWVQVALGPGDRGGAIDYCRLTDEASIVWAANLAALELHAPMARCDDIETPTMVVFDLDPGAPAGINDCAEVGLLDPRRARRARSAVLREDVGIEGPAGLRAGQPSAAHARAGVRLRARRRAGAWRSTTATACCPTCARSCARARSSSTGARTPVTRRRSARTRCGRGPSRPCRRRSPGTRSMPPPVAHPCRSRRRDVLDRVDELGDLWEPTATLQQDLPLPAG